MKNTEKESLALHVHDNINLLFEETNMPYCFKPWAEVYIMQGSRFVYVGRREGAIIFIRNNTGKHCREFFPNVKVNV